MNISEAMDKLETIYRPIAVETASDTTSAEMARLTNDPKGSVVGYRQELWQELIYDSTSIFEDHGDDDEIGGFLSGIYGSDEQLMALREEALRRMLLWLDTVRASVTHARTMARG